MAKNETKDESKTDTKAEDQPSDADLESMRVAMGQTVPADPRIDEIVAEQADKNDKK